MSGIVHVIRRGPRWRAAPTAYGPHKTLYDSFVRWSRMGAFDRIFSVLAAEGGPPERLMIDSLAEAVDHAMRELTELAAKLQVARRQPLLR